DWQIFTELGYRLGFGHIMNPRASREYFHHNDAVDEAYLSDWWHEKVMGHQGVTMPWEEFKRRGIYKFKLSRPHVAFQDQIEQGKAFATPSGKIEIYSNKLANIPDFRLTQFGYPIPYIPKWIEPWESAKDPKARQYPFQMVTPHPRWRTH